LPVSGSDLLRRGENPREIHVSSDAYRSLKEFCVSARKSCVSAKEPCISAKEPCIAAKEPNITAKDPCVSAGTSADVERDSKNRDSEKGTRKKELEKRGSK